MTPEQWHNVADCARRRWEAIAHVPRRPQPWAYWERRIGEFDSWQMALEKTGRTPF